MNAIIIAEQCIDTLAIYDAEENECGTADKLADDEWRCEVRTPENRHYGERKTLDDALAFLKHYGAAILAAGGTIDGFATFRVHPLDADKDGG